MKDQEVYHLLNSYKTKKEAEIHLEKIETSLDTMKILEVDLPIHNIAIEKFNELWQEQQPAER